MRKLWPALSALFALGCVNAAAAQTFTSTAVVFDDLSTPVDSNGNALAPPFLGVVQNTPHSFMGQAFSAINPGITGPLYITGMDFIVGTYQTVNFADVKINVQFFDTYTGATGGSDPSLLAFENPATVAPYSASIGSLSLTPGPPTTNNPNPSAYVQKFVSFVSAATPNGIALFNSATGDFSNLGLTISFDTDASGQGTYVAAGDTLSAGIRNGAPDPAVNRPAVPFAVGDDPDQNPQRNGQYQYFRNADGRTDYNFTGIDSRDVAQDPAVQAFSALGLRLYGNGLSPELPEPSPLAFLVLGGALSGAIGYLRRSTTARRAVPARV